MGSIIHSLGTSSCKKDVLKADGFHPPVLLKEGVNGILGVSGHIHTCYIPGHRWKEPGGISFGTESSNIALKSVKWGQTYFHSSFYSGGVL